MNPVPDRTLRLAVIGLLLATGVLTGAQLAKTAPLIPWYVDTFGMTLVGAGWVTALIGIFVALAALPIGFAIGSMGAARAVAFAALVIVPGGLFLALAPGQASIYGARLVEAAGYVVLCIALPALLASISPASWRGPVLAVWSGFVPLGYALSDAAAGVLVPPFGERAYLGAMSFAFAALLAPALLCLRRLSPLAEARTPGGAVAPAEGALAEVATLPIMGVALAFGIFVLQSVALFTFLPTFAGVPGALLVAAAVVALVTPLGNALAGLVVTGRGAPFMIALALAAFGATTLGSLAAFVAGGAGLATAGSIAIAIASGVVASALFAAIPFLVARQAAVPAAIGLVSQAGGIATIAAPPLAALVIDAGGWTSYGWFLAACGMAGMATLAPVIAAAGTRAR